MTRRRSLDDDPNRVAPRLSLWAAAAWGLATLASLPAAASAFAMLNTPGAFDRGDPAMALPLLPVAFGLECGFHLRRFCADRRVWDALDPKPARSPLWWLMPFPSSMGGPREDGGR